VSFLSPWTALAAAAIAIPALLLLYVLKLRRRRLRMASTLLWQRSFEDLQANVPFQRLRLSSLFVVQLLLLLLLLLALGEPVIETAGSSASRVILLIDRSASMSATDAGGDPARTRLAAALATAKDLVARLTGSGGSSAVMVIAFAARPQLVTGFESRRDVLLDAIDSVSGTDEIADLGAALELAATFAGGRRDEAEEPPDVVLISDGGVAPPSSPAGYLLRAGRFRFVQALASAPDAPVRNVGVVSLSARRDYDDPARVLVFARLVNAGPEPVETSLTLLIDGTPGSIRRVRLDAATGDEETGLVAGSASASFTIDLPGGAVISVRHGTPDPMPADDTAAVVLPPPIRPRVAFVFGEDGVDRHLLDLLEESDPRDLRRMTIDAFDAEDERAFARRFDLVVFDRVSPARLPSLPTVSFGAAPPGVHLAPAPGVGGRRILSWQRQHVLLRHVSLDTIVYAGAGGLRLPAGGDALAMGPDGPVIGLFQRRGAPHIVVAFALVESNWATHIGVTIFLQNVLEFTAGSRSGQFSLATRPGEPVVVHPVADVETLLVSGMATEPIPVAVTMPGPLTLPPFRRAGLYSVTGVRPPHDRIAVSILAEAESDTRPRRSLLVAGRPAAAGGIETVAPRPLWPWFVGAVLAMIALEWIVYCRRLRS